MLESKRDLHRRLTLLALALALCCLVMVFRLVQWQVIEHRRLSEEAFDVRDARTSLEPRRGHIFDRNGHPLAFDIYEWEISITPSLVVKAQELDVAEALAPLVGWTVEDLQLALQDKDAQYVLLDRHAPYEVGLAALEIKSPALRCEPRPRRVYPEANLLSHVVGFVNDARDGFYGVEGYYDQWLRGEPGVYRRETYPDGTEIPFGPTQIIPPKPGRHLTLTLDRNIQLIVRQELTDALAQYGASSGTVVVMDPKTGGILALVSLPDYDPNHFSTTDPERFVDPATSNQYEPGSIFKIITWGAALDAAIVVPDTVVVDNGQIEVGGRTIRNYDFRAYGQVTIQQGLVKSLNTVAAHISTTLRKERFYTYLRRFGIGHITGIDLYNEASGRMRLPGDSSWYPSDLGTNAFGQGIAVTPVQMVTAAAAIANKGLSMRPHLLASWTDGEQAAAIEPSPVRHAISAGAAQLLTEMLVKVVEEGATEAQVPGYRMAGKTGTAEVPIPGGYHPEETIASFVGWGPVDDPAFVMLVKLDKPTSAPWGSRTAAPTFSRIAEQLFAYLQIPPDHLRVAQQ
jgi:cell division protein FtsI/penicillin-binding protein 2